jgi:hypothetical protein
LWFNHLQPTHELLYKRCGICNPTTTAAAAAGSTISVLIPAATHTLQQHELLFLGRCCCRRRRCSRFRCHGFLRFLNRL